jgi:very-short-patch-repair endonuclease
MLYYNKDLKGYSRQLRKDMTNAERLLWSRVRRKRLQGYQFYTQKIIGNYIVDFYCPKAKLVIEIDGGQHYEDKDIKKDNVRDDYLREQRLTVLRFSDREVFDNLDGVIERINENLESP